MSELVEKWVRVDEWRLDVRVGGKWVMWMCELVSGGKLGRVYEHFDRKVGSVDEWVGKLGRVSEWVGGKVGNVDEWVGGKLDNVDEWVGEKVGRVDEWVGG